MFHSIQFQIQQKNVILINNKDYNLGDKLKQYNIQFDKIVDKENIQFFNNIITFNNNEFNFRLNFENFYKLIDKIEKHVDVVIHETRDNTAITIYFTKLTDEMIGFKVDENSKLNTTLGILQKIMFFSFKPPSYIIKPYFERKNDCIKFNNILIDLNLNTCI
jgi:hypothetical protein